MVFDSLEEVQAAVTSVALTINNDRKLNERFRISFTQFSSVSIVHYEKAICNSNYGLEFSQMDSTEARIFRQAIRQETRYQMGDSNLERVDVTDERLAKLHSAPSKVDDTAADVMMAGTVHVSVIDVKTCSPFDSKHMWGKLKPQFKEEKSMEITRPVLVGSVNILEATDAQLTQIIRDCKARIEADADMTKISTKFQEKAAELEEVITICLKQLDGVKS